MSSSTFTFSTIDYLDIINRKKHTVLLTIRPFNEDGSWGAKAKKEYLLDDEGNFTYTKSGAKRSRKITTTNWDDKETLARWRSAWAFYANEHLRLAGHSVTISEKSNEALNKMNF